MYVFLLTFFVYLKSYINTWRTEVHLLPTLTQILWDAQTVQRRLSGRLRRCWQVADKAWRWNIQTGRRERTMEMKPEMHRSRCSLDNVGARHSSLFLPLSWKLLPQEKQWQSGGFEAQRGDDDYASSDPGGRQKLQLEEGVFNEKKDRSAYP